MAGFDAAALAKNPIKTLASASETIAQTARGCLRPSPHGDAMTTKNLLLAKNPLLTLRDRGQAVWLDFLSRDFLRNGGLERLIEQDGLAGVTSNPAIFEKA